MQQRKQPDGSVYWAIAKKEDNKFTGYIALHQLNSGKPVFSFAILPKFRRTGVATESIKALVDYVKTEYSVDQLIARTHLHNKPSRSLLESISKFHQKK